MLPSNPPRRRNLRRREFLSFRGKTMKSRTHRAAVQPTQIYCTCGLSLLTVCCIRNLLIMEQINRHTCRQISEETQKGRKRKRIKKINSRKVQYLKCKTAESRPNERQDEDSCLCFPLVLLHRISLRSWRGLYLGAGIWG